MYTSTDSLRPRSTPDSLPFTGAIDEVMVLNVALGEADIQNVMNSGIAGALGGTTAVSPVGRLATAWGDIKTR